MTISKPDSAIQLRGVGKRYKRFAKRRHRVLDVLGFPLPKRAYNEFWAVRDIDLEVPKGARLGLIGRNGAGKSTLLRLIAGQTRASAGSITVRGEVQALMELGTGFHPDFTGLQNIRSALGYHGLSGKEIQRRAEEIIDFTELEAFIERPVREYSSGMYARLAFAVATSIQPEVLIVDEILGAGDAYFIGKSVRRMKALAESGATILFVSHDMSSVQMLCDRSVWLQQGRIVMQGDTLEVSKAYLAKVREEEEEKQRARTLQLTSKDAAQLTDATRLFRLQGENGRPPRKPVLITGIRASVDGKVVENLDPASGSGERPGSRLIMDTGKMNWGETARTSGRTGRLFGDFGGRFLHAPLSLEIPLQHGGDCVIEVDHGPVQEPVTLDVFDPDSNAYVKLFGLETARAKDGIVTSRGHLRAPQAQEAAALPAPAAARTPELAEAGAEDAAVPTSPSPAAGSWTADMVPLRDVDRYGKGGLKITAFGFFGPDGERRHVLVTGEPAAAVFRWEAEKPVNDATAVLAVYQGDGTCAMQVVSKRDGFDCGTLQGTGLLRISFDPLRLGPGEYVVSVAFFKQLELVQQAEPEAYDLHDRCYTLKVIHPENDRTTIGTVNQPAAWQEIMGA